MNEMDTTAEGTFEPATEPGPIRSQAGRVVSEVRELGNVAAHTTGEALDSAKDKSRELLDATRRETRKAREHVEEYVRENPLGAVAVAAGVGALLVVLLKR